MTVRQWLRGLGAQEDLNFLLTNRIPRLAVTHFMGWFSHIQNPWVCRVSIYIWRLFTDIDLSEARQQKFSSLHDFFIRELKDGARPVDMRENILTSPCDGILGSGGGARIHSSLMIRDQITLRLSFSFYSVKLCKKNNNK